MTQIERSRYSSEKNDLPDEFRWAQCDYKSSQSAWPPSFLGVDFDVIRYAAEFSKINQQEGEI